MDRQQKIQSVKNQSGRASMVRDLRVVCKSIHPNYRLVQCDGTLSDTGHLEVLKIVHSVGGVPSFSARWDWRADQLDIDIRHPSEAVRKDFKKGRGGYSGHWTNRSNDPNSRTFEINIQSPDGVIFNGEASFSLTFEVNVHLRAEARVSVEATVVRGTSKD
jgi:hypothetical protein